MAISLKGGYKPAAPAAGTSGEAAKPNVAPLKTGMAFLRTGKAAQEEMVKVEFKAESAQKGKFQRYWMPDGADGTITFLDGDLSEGILDIPFYYEHQIHMNGSWRNWFICTQDEEPCPICEGGHQPSYVGVMTVIDHSEYTSKKDNKTYKDQIRLYVAKRDTIKQLQKIAGMSGGLRGMRFNVSRTGDKSAAVGNVFFPVGTKMTSAELSAKYKENAAPFKYDELLSSIYYPAKELRKLGFGSAHNPTGNEKGLHDDHDYSQEL